MNIIYLNISKGNTKISFILFEFVKKNYYFLKGVLEIYSSNILKNSFLLKIIFDGFQVNFIHLKPFL